MFDRCTPSERVPRIICRIFCFAAIATIIAFIIIGIIIASTFKIPEITIASLNAGTKAPTISLQEIKMEWIAKVSVKNPSGFEIVITSLNVEGTIEGTGVPVAKGTNNNIVLPGNNQVTNFDQPLDVSWTLQADPNRRVLDALTRSCLASGESLTITYDLYVWARVFGLGPFPVPKITQKASQKCPVSINVNNVLETVEMPSSLTAATKANKLPLFIDKINSLGSPSSGPNMSVGEGSSFLSIPCKRNYHPRFGKHGDIDGTDFKSALISYIKRQNLSLTEHTDSPSITHQFLPSDQQWYVLNQLRVHAGSPERTMKGIELLMNYFAQLCWLEEKFPFESNKLPLEFAWYESFQPKKKRIEHLKFLNVLLLVETFCIQYEKSAVMWNIGALYSQLGTIQSLWTSDGLKLAAQYFQKAAGSFVYVRDCLAPRIMVKVDSSSDLSESTLTAVSEIMLAQAIECYYMKAEYDNTSSPVTSQIAAQVSDYYDMAYKAAKQNNSFGKYRFPKVWISQLHIKHLLYLGLAHFHCPNFCPPSSVVGERQARLQLALDIVTKALEKCSTVDAIVSPELRVLTASIIDKIRYALDEVDKANFDDFHQSVVSRNLLKPLRRPPHSLVGGTNVVDSLGCGSINDLIQCRQITDLFEGVPAMTLMYSGLTTGLAKPLNKYQREEKPQNLMPSNNTNHNKQSTSLQSLQRAMEPIRYAYEGPRRFTEGDILEGKEKLSTYASEKIKVYLAEANEFYARFEQDLTQSIDATKNRLADDLSEVKQILATILNEQRPVKDDVVAFAQSMLKRYMAGYEENERKSTKEIVTQLDECAKRLTSVLLEADLRLDNNEMIRARVGHKVSNMTEILNSRSSVQKVKAAWIQGITDSSLPNSVSQKEVDALILEAAQEGFNELFPAAEGDDQINWNPAKVETVIPCLQQKWLIESRVIHDKILSLGSALGLETEPLSSRKSVECLSMLIARMDSLKQEINGIVSKLESLRTLLIECRNKHLPDAQQPLNGRVIIEKLKRLSKMGELSSASDQVMQGIEVARGEMNGLSETFNQMLFMSSSIKVLLENENNSVAEELKACANLIQVNLKEHEESEKIIAVFLEQIEKWENWRMKSRDSMKSMEYMEGLLIKTTIQEKVNRKQNQNKADLESLMEKQVCLQRKQAEYGWKIAEATVEEANKYNSPFQNAFDVTNDLNCKKRDAMRRLSQAASAVDRMAKTIEIDAKDSSSEKLINQGQELKQTLISLHNQQREFLRLHNEQMHAMNDMANSNSTSRRSSTLQKAKDKFLNVVKKAVVGDSGHQKQVVIGSPTISKYHRKLSQDSGVGQSSSNLDTSKAIPASRRPSAPQLVIQKSLPPVMESKAFTFDVERRKSVSRKPVASRRSTGSTAMYNDEFSAYQPKPQNLSINTGNEMNKQQIRPDSINSQLITKKSYHFVDHPAVLPHNQGIEERTDDLKSGMDAITKFFAWNRKAEFSRKHSL